MSESYTAGGDTLVKCDNPTWQGQTFRVLEAHTLEYIDLEVRSPLIGLDPVLQIFFADADHEPYGDCLSRNRFTLEKHSTLLTIGRARFSMQPYLLEPGYYYVLVVLNAPALGQPSLYWQYDAGDASYPRGIRISTPDSGVTWTKHYNDDFMFAEFGDPPLPKPEPPPPIKHFAAIDSTYTHWDSQVMIRIPTSVPCHLTCYYTDKTPRKHHTSRIVRGLKVPWQTYFCFVAWKELEQEEPGDTLYHTFHFQDWLKCQTKWFTLRGEVDNLLSPSVGPIFKHHNPGSVLMEHWNTGDNTSMSIRDDTWVAQVFESPIPFNLTSLRLKLAREGWPGDTTCTINTVDIFGRPTDTILRSMTIRQEDIPPGWVPPQADWVKVPLWTSLPIVVGTRYAIILKCLQGDSSNKVWWNFQSPGLYPNGFLVYTTNAGEDWWAPFAMDTMFETYS